MDLEQLILITVVLITSMVLGSIIYLKLSKGTRAMKRGNSEAILSHYNVLLTINEDQKVVIQSLKGKLNQQNRKITDLEGFEQEEPTPQLNVTQFRPIAAALGINEQQLGGILEDPKVKKWLSKGENLQLLQIALPFLQSKLTQNQQGALDQGAVQSSQVGA